jgi:hypothetical protein
MTDKPFGTGGCLCGAVTFTVAAAPILMAQCHCLDCQRATGTGHISNARFRREDVSISGKPATYSTTAASGNTNTRHFCGTCGSRLFSESSARPNFLNVHAGAFADNRWFDPQFVLFKKDQPVWDITTEDVPYYDGMPPPQ